MIRRLPRSTRTDTLFPDPALFRSGMINGRGWICIALVIFASWRPGKALAGALLFAAFEVLQIRVQQASSAVIPYQFFLMMPYVLSILADRKSTRLNSSH